MYGYICTMDWVCIYSPILIRTSPVLSEKQCSRNLSIGQIRYGLDALIGSIDLHLNLASANIRQNIYNRNDIAY